MNSPLPQPRSDDALAAWQAEMAEAGRNPWLASVLLSRLPAIHGRFAELSAWLAALPRRLRRGLAKRWAVALPAAALLMAVGTWSAQAATITVGLGGCTLADAITAANTDAVAGSCPAGNGADTINFNAAGGSYGTIIALPVITSDITIQGNGNTTIQRTGGGAFSVLSVIGGSLALNNATITGGSATYAGGGIYCDPCTLSLDSTTVSGNTADSGGGIYSRNDSDVAIRASTISSNSSDRGGGIHSADGSLTIVDSTISNNRADGSQGGGGVHIVLSTTSITDSTISGNSTNGTGGGIQLISVGARIADSTISGNVSTGALGGGGIAYLDNSTFAPTNSPLYLTNLTIAGNSATAGSGGGVFIRGAITTHITGSTISGNSAAVHGGGIMNRDTGSLDAVNATISGNSAGIQGGAVYNGSESTVQLDFCTITGNASGTGNPCILSETGLLAGDASASSDCQPPPVAFGNVFGSGAGDVSIQNSIVAQQVSADDCSGSVTSGGYNIESGTSCGFTGTGDQQSVTVPQLNLAVLALNAPGTTQTHALGAGSFALDKIPSGTNGCGSTVTDDQRGIVRPQNGACEVGAFEVDLALAASISDPFGCTGAGDVLGVQAVVQNNGAAITNLSVTSTLPAGLTGVGGSCIFVGGGGGPTCAVNPGGVSWTGDLPAMSTLTINYQVQIGAGVATGATLCIDTLANVPNLIGSQVTACSTLTCPPLAPTAVDLRFFRAIGLADRVTLVWETANEADALGFNVYRAQTPDGPWTLVNPALIPARGGAAAGMDYVLRDQPGTGTFTYKLEDLGADSKRTAHPVIEVQTGQGASGRQVHLPSLFTAREGRAR